MSTTATLAAISQHDYDLIESAVRETERGRWFLDEYARRNRSADTDQVLAAIARLEGAVLRPDGLSQRLLDELRTVGRVLSEVCDNGALSGAFQSGVERGAECGPLRLAEDLQETGWTLRTRAPSPRDCDLIDKGASELFASAARIDHAARREALVLDILRAVEANIATVVARFGDSPPDAAMISPAPPALAEPPRPQPPHDPAPLRTEPAPQKPQQSPLAAFDALPADDRLRLFH